MRCTLLALEKVADVRLDSWAYACTLGAVDPASTTTRATRNRQPWTQRTSHPHVTAQPLWHAHRHGVEQEPHAACEATGVGDAALALVPVLILPWMSSQYIDIVRRHAHARVGVCGQQMSTNASAYRRREFLPAYRNVQGFGCRRGSTCRPVLGHALVGLASTLAAPVEHMHISCKACGMLHQHQSMLLFITPHTCTHAGSNMVVNMCWSNMVVNAPAGWVCFMNQEQPVEERLTHVRALEQAGAVLDVLHGQHRCGLYVA